MSCDYRPDPTDPLRPMLCVLQIIVLAIAMGAASLLVVVVVLGKGATEPSPQLLLGLAVMSVSVIAARLIVPPLVTNAARKRLAANDPPLEGETLQKELFRVLQTRTIISVALIEGPTFFAGVIYLLTRDPIGLAVGVGGLAIILAHFPTRGSVDHWLENQQTLLESEQQMGALR